MAPRQWLCFLLAVSLSAHTCMSAPQHVYMYGRYAWLLDVLAAMRSRQQAINECSGVVGDNAAAVTSLSACTTLLCLAGALPNLQKQIQCWCECPSLCH
jgi:hypothetical protein